jgi:hypothetical protein
MIGNVARSLDEVSRGLCRCVTEIGDVFFSSLNPTAPRLDELSESERERIRQSLWRLRRDLEDLPTNFIDDVSSLLDDAFGGPDALVRAVRAWADLVDTLVLEAERELGGQTGRGPSKKRQVKGALLYLVRHSDADIPRVPAFVEPIVWDLLLDSVIDAIVQLANRHSLWGDVPPSPSFRARMNANVQRVGSLLELPVRGLSKLAWALVFLCSPVSPRLKASVHNFLQENPQPVRTVIVLGTWVTRHTGSIVSLTDLVSVVVLEAQFVVHANQNRRRAYARELLLAFLDAEIGLPDRNTLWFRLLVSLIDFGIEIVEMLFEKHQMPGR